VEEHQDNNAKGTIQGRVNRRITVDNMEVPNRPQQSAPLTIGNRPQQSTRLTIGIYIWIPACFAHTVLAKERKNGFSSWMVRIVTLCKSE
jgi:hypothetical protein